MPEYSYDAVFYEAFKEEEALLKKALPSGYRYLFTWKTIKESGHEIPPAKVISSRTQSKYPLEWADSIEGIITRSTGYDHVSAYLSETGNKKLKCAYLPDYAARAVAEQAMMMWTALLRKMKSQEKALNSFARDNLTGYEIAGKTLLVIGVGRIGSQVVDIGSGLRMNLFGVDVKPDSYISRKYSLKYVSLEEGLKDADVAVCALPLTEKTNRLLNYQELSKIKHGGIFINIARGEISPSEDLLRLLEEKHLSGVGLDVYDGEKELAYVLRDDGSVDSLPSEVRKKIDAVLGLLEREDVVMTPHNAFNTFESLERKCEQTAANLRNYFKTGDFKSPIPCL